MRHASVFARHRAAIRRSCGIAGLLTAITLSLPLLRGLFYCGLDLSQLDLAFLCEVDNLRDASASLWLSPHMGNGSPLLLRPAAQLLYPLRWLLLWLPVEWASSVGVILHLTLAATAATWLAFTFRARPLTAVCVGLTYALSGTAVNLILHQHYMAAAPWLPLVWAGARRALHRRERAWHRLLVGLGLGLLLLGAEPQSCGVGIALVALEVARRRTGWRRHTRARLALLATIPAGLAIGAVLWTGYWIEGQLTPRTAALGLADALGWSFDSTLWPAALWPGTPFTEVLGYANLWRLVQQGAHVGSVWNPTPYVGLLFVTLLICGLLQRQTRVAAVVFTVGLLLALGDNLPLLPLLMKLLPPLSLFRYPQKYLLITTLAGSLVAVIACARLMRQRVLRRRFLVAGGAMLAANLVIVVVLFALRVPLDALAAETFDHPALRDRIAFSTMLQLAVLQAMAPLAAAMLLPVLAPRWRYLGTVLIVVDVWLASLSAVHVGPSLLDLPSPLPAMIARAGDPRPVICSNYNVKAMSIEAPEGDPVWSTMAMFALYGTRELQACHRMRDAVPYDALRSTTTWAYFHLLSQNQVRAARALGCTHVVSGTPPVDEPLAPVPFEGFPASVQRFLALGPQVYRLPSPVPPVFVARAPVLATDEEEAVTLALRATTAEGVVAVVDDPLHRLSGAEALPAGQGVERVEVSWSDPARATLHAAGAGAAVVGLRSAFLVGWQARQGDRTLPVVRVSGQQLAVVVEAVEAGPIELEYRSPAFYPSLLASLGGFGALVALAFLGGRGRARKKGA